MPLSAQAGAQILVSRKNKKDECLKWFLYQEMPIKVFATVQDIVQHITFIKLPCDVFMAWTLPLNIGRVAFPHVCILCGEANQLQAQPDMKIVSLFTVISCQSM